MNQLKSALVIAATLLGSLALQTQAGVSPHETINATIDGSELKVVYGRPYSKAPGGTEIRKIWGGLVPWGKAWRMGADQATLLTTSQPLVIGTNTIPAGTYSLYLIPQETGMSKLAISKRTGQWGVPVDETQDLARVDAKKSSIEKQVDQFTMAIEKNTAGGGILKLTWEKTEFSVPFTVKK
jgi:hypothetical protein